MVSNVAPSIDIWIGQLRNYISHEEPALLGFFETYAAEAKFGRSFIDANLKSLHTGESVLEVGAGTMILSCQLSIEGYDVTALEPTGDGFSHFYRLREIVLEQASEIGVQPKKLLIPAEEMKIKNQYTLAFSINVMEHVDDVALVTERVVDALHSKGIYHFTCPNYSFPYEPHFEMPTLFNKRLTELLLISYIRNYKKMPDPMGTWRSLNWICVAQLKGIVKNLPRTKVDFNTKMLTDVFLRVSTDKEFSSRRSVWIKGLIRAMTIVNLHKLLKYIPASVQPIINCTIAKSEK